MKRLLVLLLLFLPNLVSAQELHTFSNGEVADAEKINENFESLKNRIDEKPDSTCSVTTSSGVTSINCPDGTSASIHNQTNQPCVESDFTGVWLYDEVNSLDGYQVNAYDYIVEAGGSFTRWDYIWTPADGFVDVAQYSGNWSFDGSDCSAQISAPVTSSEQLEGLVWISPAKSVARGFFCDAITGCAAGVLTRYVIYDSAKGSFTRGRIRGTKK